MTGGIFRGPASSALGAHSRGGLGLTPSLRPWIKTTLGSALPSCWRPLFTGKARAKVRMTDKPEVERLNPLERAFATLRQWRACVDAFCDEVDQKKATATAEEVEDFKTRYSALMETARLLDAAFKNLGTTKH